MWLIGVKDIGFVNWAFGLTWTVDGILIGACWFEPPRQKFFEFSPPLQRRGIVVGVIYCGFVRG
jgi:hypothetical protein